MSLVINFSIDKWTESMLSITSSQKCSLIYLVIHISKPISLNIQNALDRDGKGTKKQKHCMFLKIPLFPTEKPKLQNLTLP